MSQVTKFPTPPHNSLKSADSAVSEERLSALKSLIKTTLSREEQELLVRYLSEIVGPVNQPRRGDVVSLIASIIPHRKDWTVGDIKQSVIQEHGVPASSKEIYNAIGYLSHTGQLKRVAYGQYIFNGVMMTTSEDFGGETDRHEDLSDMDPSDRAPST